MRSAGVELSDAAKSGAPREPIRILAICPTGTNELGCGLQAALQPARNVEVVREILPDGDPQKSATVVCDLLEKYQSSILLLCISIDGVAGSEFVFEAVRKNHQNLPIIAILERGEPDQLSRLLEMGA